MMRWLKEEWHLRKLYNEAEQIRHVFVELGVSGQAMETIAARNVENTFAIEAIKTDRILRLTDRYDVPMPSMLLQGTENDYWNRSPFDKNLIVLNERARADLRAEIWAVKKAIWEDRTRWVPLLAGITGILGAAIGFAATIKKLF